MPLPRFKVLYTCSSYPDGRRISGFDIVTATCAQHAVDIIRHSFFTADNVVIDCVFKENLTSWDPCDLWE
ncbi:MAG: hypothetical protein IJO56_05790 [Oscillospiraceae bacterium]|nr:hypothetical protein [Oscillospiraceae bacterium]